MPSFACPVTSSAPSPAIVRSAAEYTAALGPSVSAPGAAYASPSVRTFVVPSASTSMTSSASSTTSALASSQVTATPSSTRRTMPASAVWTVSCPSHVPLRR